MTFTKYSKKKKFSREKQQPFTMIVPNAYNFT